jgi:pimeloyl-ACP methyl ester carboxylesterase
MQAPFKQRPRRRLLKLALTIVAGLVVAYYLVIPTVIAFVLIHYRQPICCVTPAQRGLTTYEDVSFTTADGLTLVGWYVPSRNGAAIIALHGSGGNRMATLDHGAMLARHGYGVLLLDLRGHGNSGGHVALGWDANLDIDAALAYLRIRPDVDPQRIGALGLLMGGEVAMQAAAHTERLKAVASDGAGARAIGDRLSGPINLVAVPAMWTSTYAMALFTGLTPPPPLTELIPRIAPRPLLIISAGHGIGGEVELSDIFYAAAGEPKQHWQIPEARHTGGLAARSQESEAKVIAFFDVALARSSTH